jgi:hypothetical protein
VPRLRRACRARNGCRFTHTSRCLSLLKLRPSALTSMPVPLPGGPRTGDCQGYKQPVAIANLRTAIDVIRRPPMGSGETDYRRAPDGCFCFRRTGAYHELRCLRYTAALYERTDPTGDTPSEHS